MAIRDIVIYPDRILKERCVSVEVFDEALSQLVADMSETMYAAPGVGLAANQVGDNRRVFIVDVASSDDAADLHVFVNPSIVERQGEIVWEEGCLSFPEVYLSVTRSAWIKVRAQDVSGAVFELEAEGLFAVAIQHELDHLNGQSMADKMGYLKRKMVSKELTRLKKERSHR